MNDSEKAKLIMSIVSKETGVTTEQFLGERGTWKVSAARNIAVYLIRKHTGMQLNDIAVLFKRGTVKPGVKAGKNDIDVNPKSRAIAKIVEREMATK